MATFTAMPSSLTSADQERLLEALSTDGTYETIDREKLARMIANNDASIVPVEDLVFIYTDLTGTFPSFWDPELADPDLVDDLQEWADLATSDDVKQDIEEFIALIGPDTELATALGGSSSLLATGLGGVSTLTASTMTEIVTAANDYWSAKQYRPNTQETSYESAISLAFSMGSPALALIYILAGFTDPDTGKKTDGFMDIINEGQENVTDDIMESSERMADLNDDILSIDMEDPDGSAQMSVKKNEYDQESSKMSVATQLLTTMQTMISTLIDVGVKMQDITYSTNQKINA